MKENGLKRLLCLSMAALLLLAFAACSSKAKKNQVVHVGETVQYGPLMFTFDDYEIKEREEVQIKLSCETTGSNEYDITRYRFKYFVDGISVNGGSKEDIYTLIPGRGPVKISLWVSDCDDARRVEIDYLGDYTREWGKLTFVVDLP